MTALDAPTAPLPRHAFTFAAVAPPFVRPTSARSHAAEQGPGCAARCPTGLGVLCTENAGHEPSDHIARGARGQVLGRWSSTGGP